MDHIGNLLAAKAMIDAMPNAAFSPGLVYFANQEMVLAGPACGAVGCFCGWIAQDPYFSFLGVTPGRMYGEPKLLGFTNREVSNQLFGSYGLFSRRNPSEHGDEKTIILNRIDAALAENIGRLNHDYT